MDQNEFFDFDFTGHSGGRGGTDESGWVKNGYELLEIEPLRQQLISQNDIGRVQKAIQKLSIFVKRSIIQSVKNYNFDSQGIAFTYENYAAWRRLATAKGTIGDVAYLIHEIAEVEELERVQSQTGFNFMGKDFKTFRQVKQWENDFERYYKQAHSKALEAEYQFMAQQLFDVTNGRLQLSFLHVAAIDPTRYISLRTQETEAAKYLVVDGVTMKKHRHYNAWCQRANEIVSLGKRTQQRIGYYQKKITLVELIRYVKNMPIN